MQTYSFYDIPSVMLACVRIIVNREEETTIVLINADEIKQEVDRLITNTKVKVIYRNV